MSSVAIAAKGNKRPFKLLKGVSQVEDLANGVSALGLLMMAGGNWYYCDPTNGTAAGDALTPQTATNSLATAYSYCRSGYNDGVILIGGATAYNPSTAITWSNSYCHLIGANNGLTLGSRSRIVNTAGNDLATLFTLSGSGCLVANIKFSDEKDNAADGACVLVSGDRNHLLNCEIAGMADATASGPFSRAGSYSLKVSGQENIVDSCSIGIDTVDRTAANSELIVSGARNRFRGCDFRSSSTTAGKFLVKIDNSGGDLRDTQFEDCLFFNYTSNWATGITNAFSMPAGGSTHYVTMRGNNTFVGVGMGVADTVTRIYSAAPAPNAGFGIGLNPTT